MIKKLIILAIILIMTSSFTGCSTSEEDIKVIELTDEEINNLEDIMAETIETANEDVLPRVPLAPIPDDRKPPMLKKEVVKPIEKISIGASRKVTGMGMVYMIEEHSLDKYDSPYTFSTSVNAGKLLQSVATGEFIFAAVPTYLAAAHYNETKGAIQLLGINCYGGLYVIENGENILEVKDLENREIAFSGRVDNGQYAFSYVLESNGVEEKNMPAVINLKESTNVSSALISGEAKLGLLSEPFVSNALRRNEALRIALDLSEEWRSVTNDAILPMGCIIVNKEFASANRREVELFVQRYSNSIAYANKNPEIAGQLAEKHNVNNNVKRVTNTIPRSQLTWIDAESAKDDITKYLEVLFELDNNSIGGKVPDESFFYQITE